MSTRKYAMPVDATKWTTPSEGEVTFNWEYDEGRDNLLSLYEKGKNLQWNGQHRIDWSIEIDLDNPLQAPEMYNPLFGTAIWSKLSPRQQAETRRHMASWQFSQFLHGEQGALVCAAKIVETVPDMDAKFYAATQVMDEARHVEVYAKYLNDKLQLIYPINPHLKTLLEQILRDPRWDFTYLGMQILIEGLALAAFGTIRDLAMDPLAVQLNAYVMQDEARHVAFGRFALRDFYPQLTEAERGEREEFCIQACYLMRDRFLAQEVWRNLELGAEAEEHVKNSLAMKEFQKMLFSRIVPALKEIGLWGTRVQRAFEDMGVIAFANLDLNALSDSDERKALELDAAKARADEGIAATVELATAE
ncbi:MAG TPA: ferritin-like domain-containing protein [Kofleriaceae bacterium]|nr:ferritin-like domain-containing protein [Kofleriaceae bacterium]